MKAQELRIGNYVNVPNESQCPFRIDAFECLSESFIKVAQDVFISEKKVHSLTWYGKDIAPILLTEEWLIKFGFESEQRVSGMHYWLGSVCIWKLNDMFFCDKMGTQFKYVHRLQNFCYEVNGKELTLKENTNGN